MTSSNRQAGDDRPSDSASRVQVTIPADPARLPLLRSIAAALAVSVDLDIDTMADLRMAVDELAATVVTRAQPGSLIQVEFVADGNSVTVQAHAAAADLTPIDEGSFGWMVLTTLADAVQGTVNAVDGGGPEVHLSLSVRSAQAVL